MSRDFKRRYSETPAESQRRAGNALVTCVVLGTLLIVISFIAFLIMDRFDYEIL